MENKIELTIVESPCVRNCCLDGNDICMGCFRSLAEITQWTLVDKKMRKEFLSNVAERKAKHLTNLKQ
jgi:predicted Fe-S protein YdhL (DUF1289 family)